MKAGMVLLGLLAVVITPPSARAQAVPEILILGTFHMANPGHDIHNMDAGDILSPARQREMAELLEVLQRFRPTKIAIEANVHSNRAAHQYEAYLAGSYTLTRNEIDQIGYRLARDLGLDSVYAVDEDGDFPYYRVLNYAKANGREAAFRAMEAATGERVERQATFFRTHTILETLAYMNADSSVARDVGAYYEFVPFGEPYEYAGADLVASWFQRNIRIYSNIRALVTSADDRILVIYGAGHLGWLRQFVASDPAVRLRTLADLVTSR